MLHEQVSLIWPDEAPYDYKSMKEIHMAEGDPRAGITEVGIDSPQGIEKARKVTSHMECASKPFNCTRRSPWRPLVEQEYCKGR